MGRITDKIVNPIYKILRISATNLHIGDSLVNSLKNHSITPDSAILFFRYEASFHIDVRVEDRTILVVGAITKKKEYSYR